jgi:hypothetical protein
MSYTYYLEGSIDGSIEGSIEANVPAPKGDIDPAVLRLVCNIGEFYVRYLLNKYADPLVTTDRRVSLWKKTWTNNVCTLEKDGIAFTLPICRVSSFTVEKKQMLLVPTSFKPVRLGSYGTSICVSAHTPFPVSFPPSHVFG